MGDYIKVTKDHEKYGEELRYLIYRHSLKIELVDMLAITAQMFGMVMVVDESGADYDDIISTNFLIGRDEVLRQTQQGGVQ